MASEKKTMYDAKYNKNFIKVKHVQFNIKSAEDVELMAWLDSHPSKNAYIKSLIRADYERHCNV